MRNFESEQRVETAPQNPVDRDFNSLEQDFPFADRLEIVRDLGAEIFDGQANPERDRDFSHALVHQQATGQDGFKHYFLPDIPGGKPGDLSVIREGYDIRAVYKATPERVLIPVGQGEMWVVPKGKNPFMRVSLSECSVILGVNGQEIVMAHISYSALNEIAAAVKFMQEHGIAPEQVRVVASVGPYQAVRSAQDSTPRALSSADYEKLGISPAHVRTFSYQPEKPQPDGRRIGRNLTQVVATKDGFFRWSFDLETTSPQGTTSRRERRVGLYKDEEATEF